MQREERPPVRILRHVATVNDRQQHQHEANHRNFSDLARADKAHVDAHEQGDRDGGGDGEQPPRAVGQGFYHHQRQRRQDDDHHPQRAEHGDHPGECTQLLLGHFPQRTSVAACGDEQHQEILHRAGQHNADQDPDGSRQEAHLRGQNRPHQRPGAGDGGKVVAEQHPFVGGHIVQAVVVTFCRGQTAVVQFKDLVGNEPAVEAIGDAVAGDGGDHQPNGVDMFAAAERQHGEGEGADQRHQQPDKS